VALGQVFYEYFGFPCQYSFHRLLHIHHHLSSGAGTIGQLVADVPNGLGLTPLSLQSATHAFFLVRVNNKSIVISNGVYEKLRCKAPKYDVVTYYRRSWRQQRA
jgi:hypothetical protein